jgi:hypothetical protein
MNDSSHSDKDMKGDSQMSSHALLKLALAVFGIIFLLIYPLALVWPSGWAWHVGAPHDSQYFMMIVGIYATLGVFLLIAARDPRGHRSVIWFTVWSSLVHGAIMAVQSMAPEHHGHLMGDVPALFVVAGVLGGLLLWSETQDRVASKEQAAKEPFRAARSTTEAQTHALGSR